MEETHSVEGGTPAKQAYSEVREHTSTEWQDLCTATERELQSRGCLEYSAIAAELLNSYGIKQSLRVKDYYRDGIARPYQSLRWATVAGKTLKNYKLIARHLCDRWQASQAQEGSTGQSGHEPSESGAQTQAGQPDAVAGGKVHQPGSTGRGSQGQGGGQEYMEQDQKRRRTNSTYTSEVNKIESVRKLFNKTVATLFDFQYPRNQQVAKWIINAKVLQVEKRQYPATGHSGDTYVTFFDNTIGPVKGLIHAAIKLAELADREAAQEPSFEWTAARKQLPLYSVLKEVHPTSGDIMPVDLRQRQERSMQQDADSSAAAGAEQASTPPQEQQAPDGGEWQTIRTLKAKTEELRSRMDKLEAELVAAQQERDALQAGLPDEEESARKMRTLREQAEQTEAAWKRKRQEAVDAESVWKRVKQEADDAEVVMNNIKQEADGIEARRSQTGAALAAKIAEIERLQDANDMTERQLATARQDVLKFF